MNKLFYIIASGNNFLASYKVEADSPLTALFQMFETMPKEKRDKVRNVAIHCLKENVSLIQKITRPFRPE